MCSYLSGLYRLPVALALINSNFYSTNFPKNWELSTHQPSFQAQLYAIAAAIWRQDWAQRRQDWAQRWQWSWLCFSHSAAQRSQASAQMLHICAWRSELRDMKRAQRSQVSAQSRHSLIHWAIICTMSPLKQALAQFSHSRRQSRQAWIQVSRRDSWDWAVVII